MALSSHFPLPDVALFETVRILRKIRSLRDRFTIGSQMAWQGIEAPKKSDRISDCTVLLLIEKMNQINTKNYWK